MQKKEYKIKIHATPQKVWFALWDDNHYRNWTNVFCEGSFAKTDNWREGSKVHFLTPDGKGMYSIVSKNIPFETMEFTHMGNIDNFQELPLDEETKQWSGGKERYAISENDGITTLIATIDLYEKYMEFFDTVFPKGLEKVKALAENFYITVQTTVKASIEKVWGKWNNPGDITKWYTATETWHTPIAENDLRIGGLFKYGMEAKDGSMGFDFSGTYTAIEQNKLIEYTMADGRKAKIIFETDGDYVNIIESFEAETMNTFDLQRDGWQAILNSFKKHTENE
jgi:uncharacterized protein YndB with AHSA1/START domain